ncbi:MAG: nucleoside kinase [Clostridiales bacterium]|nr:nucleoside kinase [Clostridiales bacterium]
MPEPTMITVQLAAAGAVTAAKGTTILELSRMYPHLSQRPVLVAKVNNELQDLTYKLLYDCAVEYLDLTDPNGFRTYQRSASFLMIYAAKEVLGRKTRVVVEHSINKNYYCEFPEMDEREITGELLARIEAVMREVAGKKLPVEKHSLPLEQAVREAETSGSEDKVRLLRYRRTSSVNFYKLDWLYDYFYGQMVPDTGYLTQFKLSKKSKGFMLQFPSVRPGASPDLDVIAEMAPNRKISEVFDESNQWARILKVETVGSLNDKLCSAGSGEIIRVAEALHEKKIASIADQIAQQHKSIVLVAGPSSSGKTTFASRLGVQLRVNGMKPHVISLDNYYLNREDIPKDEFGNYDFETIDALDNRQISRDLAALLKGERAELPVYNFLTGKREYKGRYMTLGEGDVLIMEGIHGLNERVSESVPRSEKFKVFISALTQLNIDDHNRIPTTDTRLVRRIVRDHQYRGYSAGQTISVWPSVQRGENKYIFPFQEEADVFFNSALVYEMCVLKQYIEPLLFGVRADTPERTEAKRLIKFLDSFLGVSSENVPPNSILREFIGGSCFA